MEEVSKEVRIKVKKCRTKHERIKLLILFSLKTGEVLKGSIAKVAYFNVVLFDYEYLLSI